MRSPILQAGLMALVASMIGSQGCMPFSKYMRLKRRAEQLEAELRQKESQLADDDTLLQSLREQMRAKDQLIQLYEDKSKEAEELARKARQELDQVQSQLDSRLQDIAARHPGVEAGPGKLTIEGTLLFALGSAEVSQKGKALLRDVAEKFKGSDEIIQIDGHTDDIPVKKPETVDKFGTNWGLSAMRAAAVAALLADYGIPGERMMVRAFSKFQPRAQGKTDAARRQNRRVEVFFVPPQLPELKAAVEHAPEPIEPPEPGGEGEAGDEG
ncbi:MAG: OmpA family protein [Candidatus Brocadiia bacterium]